MKLIGSSTSPFARKVRIVLAEKKLDCQIENINVWAPDSPILDYNPLGKVPCLIMDDGGVLFDSRVIVEYLDSITPVCRLLPPPGRERIEVKCWEALGDGIVEAAVNIRIENTQRSTEQRSQAWIERQQGKLRASFESLSSGLADRPFCTGNNYSLADVAVGTALAYVAYRLPELGWQHDFENLNRLREKLEQRPSFQETAPPDAG